jgi:O-antigen/teichoic acid export membrane protein
MIRRDLFFYLLARGFSAFGNLAAVAVFTRLAGPEVYGHYVVMVASALVVTGFSAQWLRFSFFNHYRSDEDQAFFATFVSLIALSTSLTAIAASAILALSGAGIAFTAGAIMIGLSIALFEVFTEVSRARLQAPLTALSLCLKALLGLICGSIALAVWGSAFALALGVSIGNVIAAIPPAVVTGRLLGGRPQWQEARKLLLFGWPLMLSFGIGALAQNADRFFLAGMEGAAAVGAYGALSDLVRACFLVVAEAVSLATIPLAKRQFSLGDRDAANHTLSQAFRLLLVVATFGASGMLVFSPVVLPLVFPADFLVHGDQLLTVVVLGTVAMVFRTIYFGQMIYFARTSRLELSSTILLAVANFTLCLVLVPRYGALGAALAFFGAQAASLAFLFFMNASGFKMPTPWSPALAMIGLGIVLTLGGRAILAWPSSIGTRLALEFVWFAIVLGSTAIAFGLRPRDLYGLRGGFQRFASAGK